MNPLQLPSATYYRGRSQKVIQSKASTNRCSAGVDDNDSRLSKCNIAHGELYRMIGILSDCSYPENARLWTTESEVDTQPA